MAPGHTSRSLDLRVGHEVVDEADPDGQQDRRAVADEERPHGREPRSSPRGVREPRRLDDLKHGPDEQQQQQADGRGHQHQEREQLVAQETPRLLHSPRVIHRGTHGAEDAVRGPQQCDGAANANPVPRLPKGIQLPGQEVELRREVPKEEVDDGRPPAFRRGDAAEDREQKKEEREERQQAVVCDGRRVGHVVAGVELDESRAMPRGQRGRATKSRPTLPVSGAPAGAPRSARWMPRRLFSHARPGSLE